MIAKSATLASKVLAKRGLKQEIVLDELFPKQTAFVLDSARFIAARCSRRAGKTNGLALRFFRTLERYPGSQCLYLALTKESAMDIMWPVLKEFDAKYKLNCIFTESNLTMKHPNGAKLRLMGADMRNFIKRIKGRKYPGVAIDEAQDFGTHLQSLVDDVLTPSTSDYEDGWLAVTGTPGPVPVGYFFEITHESRHGFSLHNWTLLENPYMPEPAKFISELMAKRSWTEDNPTLQREYRNQWVLDTESLWIRYRAHLNDYGELPPAKYSYILGIDLGYKDADALAVLAWADNSPNVYLVEESLASKQGLTELVQQIEAMTKKYDISRMVIDAGGLGKKIAEELRRRYKIPVIDAEKQRKQENVEYLNDSLRLGHFKAKATSTFVSDTYKVQIDWDKTTPDRIVIKKNFHSDIIDAVLYAYKLSPAYAYEAPVPKPVKGTPAAYRAEVDDMEQAAIDHFTALEEVENGKNWDDYT